MKQLELLIKKNQVKKVLDVGTGVGNFISQLLELAYPFEEVIGIDTSSRSIEIASKNFIDQKHIRFFIMDGNHMTFENETFDMVCLSNSLHHLTHIDLTLKEMRRVLKPQGILLFNEMISSPLTDSQMSHRMIHHFSAEIDRTLGITHNETYTKEEIEHILSKIADEKLIKSWIPKYLEQIEFTEEQIEEIILSIDRMVERLKNTEYHHDFILKGEEVKSYIQKHGFDLATTYLFAVQYN